MSIASFIDRMDPPRQTVTLVNRTRPELYYDMLAEFFEPMNVRGREADLGTDYPQNTVLLRDGDQPLAVSPFDAVYDGALGVNVDRYATGDHGLDDIETPDVVQALDPVGVPGERAGTSSPRCPATSRRWPTRPGPGSPTRRSSGSRG